MKRLILIITILYLIFLELSHNMIIGWAVAVALAVGMIFYYRKNPVEKGKYKSRVIGILLLAVILIANWKLTAPPERLVPATDERHPEVTDVVTVRQGQLTGVYTRDRSVEVYAGIPYAKPPVGDLRFAKPQEAEAWDGIRRCDHYAPMAMQHRDPALYDSLVAILGTHNYQISLKDNYTEPVSEDCLYLNIWKPAQTGDEKLPVLFFIHGGSLMNGQSYFTEYRGEDLAKKGVIVVNCAYRLGVFGYYANEDLAAESPDHTTGNYGLLDQIQALRWVNENIESFGGDPDRITIAGESAGASSVNALCVSPLADGLFRYAIAESSGIVAKHPYHTFRTMEDALAMGQDIMDEMGVQTVEELRNLPAEELIRTEYKNNSMTVDGYAIAEQPYLTYEKGENHEQALLNGFNGKEADFFLMRTKATSENYVSRLTSAFGEYAGEAAEIVPADWPARDQHFIVDAGGDAKGALDHIYSAAWFTYSHELWSSYVAAEGRPVYEYYFTKKNRSMSDYHSGELPYAYGNLWRHRHVYDESDFALSEIMQNYWVNFVKTGDPNGEGLPVWEMRDREKKDLLVLDEEIRMEPDPYRDIYPILDRYQSARMVFFCHRDMAMTATTRVAASAAGNASQTPFMPRNAESTKAKTMMATSPLRRDVTNDQAAASVAPR